MTILALLLFVGRVERVNRYGVLERNVVINEDGRETLRQWVTWDWDSLDGVHRCQWWALDRGESIERTTDGWRVTVGGKRIEARTYRETRTGFDPELADRVAWPIEKRKGVK